MNVPQALQRLATLNGDRYLQNQIAQANARYILLSTQESRENFPNYTINDEKLELLALYYINLGATLVENRSFDNAIEPLEKGSAILEYIHGAPANRNTKSVYFGLVAALSYYLSFQYSKSFILIQKLETELRIARLVSYFLQRRYVALSSLVEDMVADQIYTDGYLVQQIEDGDGDRHVYEVTIGRSLYGLVTYFTTGNEAFLNEASRKLVVLKEIAELKSDPGIWWVIRLLLLITESFSQSSLWNALGPFLDTGSDLVRKYIFSLAFQSPVGIYELFIPQRKCLPQLMNTTRQGCIISIPTSSGKTRIAELAILNSLAKDPGSKVLYIAPFRSLAYEIENTFERIFSGINIGVSQLYGGSLFNKLDEQIIDEANVIIVTPEKAKALLRSNESILGQIKLVVIDEGHLLGDDSRYIVNEIFYEELRFFVKRNDGHFLLLSAVLPNAEELAEWLTQSKDTVYKNAWRSSDERLGILEWDGTAVNLNWKNNDQERPTFNRRFIVAAKLPLGPRQSRVRYFPGDKNDAVASTAYKLRTVGSTLIFVGLKASVFTMARSYLQCLGEVQEDFKWRNAAEWKAFELASAEAYGEDNVWLQYAKKGIICHNADLIADVRIPLERLMRLDKPLVIIATSTLAQGVNIGVSNVIFSTIYQAGSKISARDFWNIAGRAGRAFVDYEGKVLVALDDSDQSLTGIQKAKHAKRLVEGYFDKENIDLAKSGVLALVKELCQTAKASNIDFPLLLDLLAGDILSITDEALAAVDKRFDLIDDTLLAIAYFNTTDGARELDLTWVETYFKRSLAVIQLQSDENLSEGDFAKLIAARISGIISQTGADRAKWKTIITSGTPLRSELFLEEKMDELLKVARDYIAGERTPDNSVDLLIDTEKVLTGLPCIEDDLADIESKDMRQIRELWLSGRPISDIMRLHNGESTVVKYFTYKLPWILNGISKRMGLMDYKEEADLLAELSVLVEIGLPHLKEVKIYQAGIRSRTAACDLGGFFSDAEPDRNIKSYKQEIIDDVNFYKSVCSPLTADWIDLLINLTPKRQITVKRIGPFTYGTVHEQTSTLIARQIGGVQYLMSPNLDFTARIGTSPFDFSPVNNLNGIYFVYNAGREEWSMVVDNPYVTILG